MNSSHKMMNLYPLAPMVVLIHTCNRMEFCSLHGDHSHHVCIPTTEIRHPPDATAAAAAEAAAAAVATQTMIPSRSGIPQWSISSA